MALINLGVSLGVFLRRLLKNRYYALKDESRWRWGRAVDELLSGGEVGAGTPSLRKAWDRAAAEEVLLERVPTATPEQLALLQSLFRRWGLFGERIRRLLWGNIWQQGRSGLILAKMQCGEAVPAIVALLSRPYVDVRLAGVNALGILAERSSLEPLLGVLPGSSGREVRAVLAAVLRCAEHSPGDLEPYLQHPSYLVRLVVAAALGELAQKEQVPALLGAVADPEPEVRAKVARALGRTRDPAVLQGLEKLVADPVWYVRLQTVFALGEIRHAGAEGLLWKVAQDPEGRVRKKAAIALYHLLRDPVRLLQRLRELGDDGTAVSGLVDELARQGLTWQAVTRVCSPVLLAREESQAVVRELLRAGFFTAALYAVETHPDGNLRRELLRLVKEFGGPAARPHLAALLSSPLLDAECRRRVEGWLARPEAPA